MYFDYNSSRLSCFALQAAAVGEVHDMMRALASGASVNYRNLSYRARTPLHVACMGVSLRISLRILRLKWTFFALFKI